MGYPIHCEKLADEIIDRVKKDVDNLVEGSAIPCLAIVTVGDDEASRIFVGQKLKVATEIGFNVEHYHFSEKADIEDVADQINLLNKDNTVHGIMVQLPLPGGFEGVECLIEPTKDVDGLTSDAWWMPCTVKAILHVLDTLETPEGEPYKLEGKHIAIANRSYLIGRPLVNHLLDRDMSVSVLHSKTKNPYSIMSEADIIISATGKPHQWLGSMLNPSRPPILIDVGCFKWGGGYCGDFAEDAQEMSYMYTPVPKGIGKVTVACLMDNLMMCYNNMQ